MQEFINVHCHLLNFDFIPDSFFITRAPIRERMLRCKLTHWLARVSTFICPGKEYDKLHEMFNMMKRDVGNVAKELVMEMEKADIKLSTPLMLDFEFSSFNEESDIPYQCQIKLVSDIAAEYPGKIMPFIMFDPRRKSASKIIKMALEEMGFLGVKMYPALGYHPDPSPPHNYDEANHELEEVYQYCEARSIPITTHCDKAGPYRLYRKEMDRDLCQPSHWKPVLKKYNKLYLNFAHFGGCKDFLRIDNSENWSHVIKDLMGKYDNVYADLSYHDKALTNKTHKRYFQKFEELASNNNVVRNRIIFGTDWPLTRHTWTEKKYVKPFTKLLPSPILCQIAFENPLNFLFPGKELPLRIKHFFKSKNICEANLPQWMKNNLDI